MNIFAAWISFKASMKPICSFKKENINHAV
jgi:hypothetical protein